MTASRFEAKDVWQADGHLSDLVLVALADGQDYLVPKPAQEHAATCESCGLRLGAAALQSWEVGAGLEGHAMTAAPASPPRPDLRRPAIALAAAFVLALLGSIPRLLELRAAFGEAPSSPLETGLVVLKSVTLLFRSANQQDTVAVTLAWCAAAVTILALGGMVARWTPPGSLERSKHASHDS